jgi:hypothetical protein
MTYRDASSDERRWKASGSEVTSGPTFVLICLADMLLNCILFDFDFDLEDVPRVTLRPCGKTRTAMGRRAGILTQMMPRAHSMTERLRLGTL